MRATTSAVAQRHACGPCAPPDRDCGSRSAPPRLASRTVASNSSNTPSAVADIQIAGRLVGQQHLRRVRQRARDRHALLLAARELAGQMADARSASPNAASSAAPASAPRRAALPAIICGSTTFSSAENSRQQMVELVDEADRSRGGSPCARASASAPASRPSTSTLPPSGRSSRPARCSSVDLPAPDGATSATISPACTSGPRRAAPAASPPSLR